MTAVHSGVQRSQSRIPSIHSRTQLYQRLGCLRVPLPSRMIQRPFHVRTRPHEPPNLCRVPLLHCLAQLSAADHQDSGCSHIDELLELNDPNTHRVNSAQ